MSFFTFQIAACVLVITVEYFCHSIFIPPLIYKFKNVLLVKQDIHHPNFTSEYHGINRHQLLAHAKLVEQLTKTKFEIFGETWSYFDLCHRMELPAISGELSDIIIELAKEITPCTIISPLDCFWEGSRLHGPVPELDVSDISPFLKTLPLNGRISWKNLNPAAIMNEVEKIGIFKIDPTIQDLFINQFGSGFLERPCLNPLSRDCPPSAPNSLRKCRKNDKIYKSSCKMSQAQLDFMEHHNRKEFEKILMKHDQMDVLKVIGQGCPAGPKPKMRRLKWVGFPGMVTDANNKLLDAGGLETALVLADPKELYERVKQKTAKSFFQNLQNAEGGWSVEMAEKVLNIWKWQMIDYMPRIKAQSFHALSSDDYYLMENRVPFL